MRGRAALVSLTAVLQVVAAGPASHRAEGQYAPGQIDVPIEQYAQWQMVSHAVAGAALKNWIEASTVADADVATRFVTDRALLVVPGGTGFGRAGVRDLLSHGSTAHLSWLAIGGVAPGARLIHVTGRTGAVYGGQAANVHEFSALLEQQHDEWLVRLMAIGSAGDEASGPVPRDAIRSEGTRVVAPERMMVRLMVEPEGSIDMGDGRGGSAGDLLGGGAGIELNGVLEGRLVYRQAREGPGELRQVGGELRAHLFDRWRVRPHLVAGATLSSGAAAADTLLAPHVGAGLAVRLTPSIDIRLTARDHFVAASPTNRGSWLNGRRTHRWILGSGISFAVGRRPEWRDPVPSRFRRDSFSGFWPPIQQVIAGWIGAINAGDEAAFGSALAPTAALFTSAGLPLRGAEEIGGFWHAIGTGGWDAEIGAADVSDHVAYAELSFRPRDGGEAVETLVVLERQEGVWRISTIAIRGEQEPSGTERSETASH